MGINHTGPFHLEISLAIIVAWFFMKAVVKGVMDGVV